MTSTDAVAWTLEAARARLPQLAAGDVALMPRVHVRAGVLALEPCGERLHVRFGAAPADPLAWVLEATRGSDTCLIELDTLDAVLGGAEATCAQATPDVRALVLAQLGAAVWDALGLAAPPPRLREVAPRGLAAQASAQRIGFVVENRVTGCTGIGALTLRDAQAARDFAAALAQHAPQPLPFVPVDVRFQVGTARVTAAELRSLHEGAVVLLTRLPSSRGRWRALVLAGSGRTPVAAGFIEGDNIVTEKVFDKPGEKGGAEAARDGARRVLETVSVELAFEIGRATLPLEQLLQLAPGHVFELGAQPEGDVVDLTLNGSVVGSGHLVLVGDVLGVRVARLWLDDPVPAGETLADAASALADPASTREAAATT